MTYDAPPPHSDKEELTTKPSEGLEEARGFFLKQFGIKTNEDGLLNAVDIETHKAALTDWSRESFPYQMPTPELFYRKTLLFISWWPQEQAGRNAYVAGKGWGAELAIQGEVVGRPKKTTTIPLRSHSDFEVYNVRDLQSEDGVWQQGSPPTPDGFLPVFTPVEAFPPGRTKFLGFSPDYFEKNYDVVNFGGIEVKIPKLEFLFVEKLLHPESGSVRGYDFQLLAKCYDLNHELIHQYLDDFHINPLKQKLMNSVDDSIAPQLARMQKELDYLHRVNRGKSPKKIIELFNVEAAKERERLYLGSTHWFPLHDGDIDESGRLTDPNIGERIRQRVIEANQEEIQDLEKIHELADMALAKQ